ncbi:MAG: hypothetical protein KF764_23895 [Labilithrix sp.]|nr:hypothetical protein [Labilithrix sp.]MBX3223650.1 hypothetical protein [Labilithrix sp.]
MNVRSVVASTLRPRLFAAASLAFVFACGPREPPRQASTPDEADPMGESSSSSSGASSSSGTGSDGNGGSGDVLGSPPPTGKVATGKGGDPPQVASLAAFTDGIKWGISHAELTKQFTQTNGVIWKDYDEKLAKARVGPEQTALEAEREQVKAAFSRSFIEFKDTPTGYDTTGIRSEYTYKNKEALMWIQRQGKKRYFFFINDRLWKMYDEVPLADGGPMGKAYLDAVNRLNAQLNAQGRVQGADAAKGIDATTVDWKDGTSHLRAVDRSNDHVVGIVVEDSGTLSNITALRPNKPADPNEIDPSITAVTKGTNRSDPNAPSAAPSGSAAGKKPPPKKK